jgi:hypothetical protein
VATLRKRSNGRWQARVQINGRTVRSKTFVTKVNAVRWVKQIKVEMQKCSYDPLRGIQILFNRTRKIGDGNTCNTT